MTWNLPDYDDLPVIEKIGLRHAWGVFGENDELGCINLLRPECRLAAAKEIRQGKVVNLSLPLNEPDPPLFGRQPLHHEIFNLDRNTLDDRLDSLYPQASSQWDSLRHVRAREFGYWGGVMEDFKPGPGRLGIEHWVEHGMVGRGVLLDIAGWFADRDEHYHALKPRAVTAAELEAVAAHQGVKIEPGDMLCLHFGWVEAYRALDRSARENYVDNITHAGLNASEEEARRLWNWHPAVLACDNPAVEVIPGDPAIGSLHRRVLPLMGFCLGEMLDFSALTRECRTAGKWTFMMTAVPLNLPGGIGSPANAIAII
ncbi:MAG: hypothetical protein TEF_15360 [Rhizobiales bacterium NRL2]|jgi:hypothetical protein|nr:MAG: hypothetical protein TEF_15360 [Rhizobiales bacterium NRL2]